MCAEIISRVDCKSSDSHFNVKVRLVGKLGYRRVSDISYLLSAASNFCIDLYSKFKPGATEEDELKVTRWFILIAGVIAYIILTFFPSILAIQYWSYTIYGAGITPAVIGALTWKKATKAGGIASMIVGCGLSIIWEASGSLFGLQTIFVAFPAALITLIVGSLLTQPKAQA